ncbi:MFS transporter [Streptomyces griseoincarnatus]
MVQQDETAPAGAATAPAGRRRAGWVLVLACAAQFMVVLDVSVVNVALPSIQSALGFAPAGLPWVVNAYGLCFAGLLLLGGRLADVLGHRRVFVLGLAVFSAASLAGGAAASPGGLIAARAVQGMGAALLAPVTLTVLTGMFPEGPVRTRALAVWTAVGVAGGAAGNLIGGALTEYLSWRWILLVNVPVGVGGVLPALRLLQQERTPAVGRPRLDVAGAVVATAALAALTYGLGQAESHGWGAPVTAGTLTAGLLALAVFVWLEGRVRTPLMPLRLFRVRSVAVGNLVLVLTGACFIPMWYFLSLYMQQVLRYSPVQTAIGFLPHTLITMAVGARVAPWLLHRVDARALILAGCAICAAGFGWQSRITPDSGYVDGILGPAVVVSVGSGMLLTPLTAAVTSGVPPSDAGAASGLMNAAKQVGGALGLAALATFAATGGDADDADLTEGYARAFTAITAVLAAVTVLALALPREDHAEPD